MRWVAALRAVEATALLVMASAAQRWAPPGKWQLVLGQAAAVPSSWAGRMIEVRPTPTVVASERRVAAAVARGVRWLPWNPSCLAQAAAGQLMLRLRGEPAVAVVGLRQDTAGAQTGWMAHAWLIGSGGVITGGEAAVGFTPTAVFQSRSGLRAVELPVSSS